MGNATSGMIACSTDSLYGELAKKTTDRGGCENMNVFYAVSEMKGHRMSMEDKHIHIIGVPVVMGKHGASTTTTMDTSTITTTDETSTNSKKTFTTTATTNTTTTSSSALSGRVILEDHALFGVFDGHGGDFTSKFLAANFETVFSRREELRKYTALPECGQKSREDANGVTLLQKALMNTFLELDEKLMKKQQELTVALRKQSVIAAAASPRSNGEDAERHSHATEEKSGSTAVVVLITPAHIICANAGDSRAMLRRNGQTLPLSFDHKPSELPEKVRIATYGGFVKGKRVNGDLAVSRAFGDFMYKDNLPGGEYGKTLAPKQKLIVVPDILVYPRKNQEDEFMVLACDGVWDVASCKQLSDFVRRMLADGEVDLGNICEESLDTCLDRQSRDNMTMMLVSLPGVKMDNSRAAALNNALWGHRTARHARNATYSTISVAQEPCTAISNYRQGEKAVVA